MGVCEHTHFWITCDVKGCRNNSDVDDCEFESQAIACAKEDGWQRDAGRWLCPEHAKSKEDALREAAWDTEKDERRREREGK